jgi:predicted  nucleic acid-binding Zn-ribbon protein
MAVTERLLRAMDQTNGKGAWSYLKETGAPGQYVQAVRNLIEDNVELEKKLDLLENRVAELTDSRQYYMEETRAMRKQLEALQSTLKDAADDLAEASRAIQKLV